MLRLDKKVVLITGLGQTTDEGWGIGAAIAYKLAKQGAIAQYHGFCAHPCPDCLGDPANEQPHLRPPPSQRHVGVEDAFEGTIRAYILLEKDHINSKGSLNGTTAACARVIGLLEWSLPAMIWHMLA